MNRIGQGVDIHPFADVNDPGSAGRPLILGGVRISDSGGLAGHSDADAVLHAVTDALLGAAGAGDIGHYFPSTDERWRNADSSQFVREAKRMRVQIGAVETEDVGLVTAHEIARFRAVRVPVVVDDEVAVISKEAAEALKVRAGEAVRVKT